MSGSRLRDAVRIPVSEWGFTDTEPGIVGRDASFKRILLAVTNSDPCRRAIAVVAILAHTNGSQVYVIHLYERVCHGRARLDVESPEEANRFVSCVLADLGQLGVRAEAGTEKSLPDEIARRIVWTAAKCGADVIVIGTRSKSALQAVLRGSVSHEIIHRSNIPILVVP